MRISPLFIVSLAAVALVSAVAYSGLFTQTMLVLEAFGVTRTQIILFGLGVLALLTAFSAMYAFIFRLACRKGSKALLEFSMLRGTVFFATVPLVCTISVALVARPLHLAGLPDLLVTALYLVATVAGTAWLSRPLLLKVKSDTLPYLHALALTAITFFIAFGILTGMKHALPLIT